MKRAIRPVPPSIDCDQGVSAGLTAFWKHLSPSHTLTSRKHSVWTLIAQHLDEPFLMAFSRFDGSEMQILLAGFRPSQIWRSPSLQVLVAARSCVEARQPLLRAVSTELSRADRAVAAMDQWDECIRLAARRSFESSSQISYIATVDAIRALISKLKHLRPSRQIEADGTALSDSSTRSNQHAFCELCWRESLRTTAYRSGQNKERARRLSQRFCALHNPRDPNSKYRCDIRYKAAFMKELNALMSFDESAYLFSFKPPRSADFQEIRKTAYDLVHSRLRPLNSDQPGLRERVAQLLTSGMRQADVARELGVSRQAVSKAKKSLESILAAQGLDAELCPVSGESVELSGFYGSAAREQICSVLSKGISGNDAAKRSERFRHSIDFLTADSRDK